MTACRHCLSPCPFCRSDAELAERVRKGTRGRYRKGDKRAETVRQLEVELKKSRAALRAVWRRAKIALEGDE